MAVLAQQVEQRHVERALHRIIVGHGAVHLRQAGLYLQGVLPLPETGDLPGHLIIGRLGLTHDVDVRTAFSGAGQSGIGMQLHHQVVGVGDGAQGNHEGFAQGHVQFEDLDFGNTHIAKGNHVRASCLKTNLHNKKFRFPPKKIPPCLRGGIFTQHFPHTLFK